MAQNVTLGSTTIGSNTSVPGAYSTDASTPMNLTITGTYVSSSGTGLSNYSTLGTVTNSGKLIENFGVSNAVGTINTLNNSSNGVISGTSAAIWNIGAIGTITNKGTISSSGGTAIANIPQGASIGAITNSGTITGLNNAIYSNGSATLGTINNTGLIAGNITTPAGDLNISGGTSGTYGTLTGYNGSIGTINNVNGNVNLSGQLVLNDIVNVGSNTLKLNYISSGSTLALTNTVTITGTGNYYQATNTTLLSNVANNAVATGTIGSDSGYGRLVVNGTATISDGAAISLQKINSYRFAAGQRFVVVQATTMSTNTSALIYGIVGNTNALVSGSTVIDGAHTDLVLQVDSVPTDTTTPASSGDTTSPTTTPVSSVAPNTPITTVAVPPVTPATNTNAIRALKGLAAYSGISNAALLNLYNAGQALNDGTAADANKAGAQLSPVTQAQAMQAAAAPSFNTLDIVGAHIDGLRLAQSGSSGVATGEGPPQYGVWGQAFGGHSSQNARDQVNGYSANYGGLLLGVDKALGDQWRLGGLFSYSNTAIYSDGSTSGNATHVNSDGLFAYAGFTAPRWYANLSMGGVAQHYTENRAINFTGFSGNANGSFSGTQWIARGELGYPLALGAFTLTPLASLTYSNIQTKSYTETDGNGAALNVGASHQTSVKSDLGAKFERTFSTQYGFLVPSLQLAWRHEYDKAKTSLAASYAADPTGETAFSTQGASPVSDSALATLGVTLLQANNLSITAQYQVQAASGYLSQAGTLRFRQLF